jgi:hypothetical protein
MSGNTLQRIFPDSMAKPLGWIASSWTSTELTSILYSLTAATAANGASVKRSRLARLHPVSKGYGVAAASS